MSFVRIKEIPPRSGNRYYYEVETVRNGIKTQQKVIRYLGKSLGEVVPDRKYLLKQIPQSNNLSTKGLTSKAICKFCNGHHTRKYGMYKGVQNYFCQDCKKRFTGTDALPHGRASVSCIVKALNEYYSGSSFHKIETSMNSQIDGHVSYTSIVKWIHKFTDEAINQTRDLHPKVGDIWLADENYFHPDLKNKYPKGVCFWDIIDVDTRFLLATIITSTKRERDAKLLIRLASKRAGKKPITVITDRLGASLDVLESAFRSYNKNQEGGRFSLSDRTSLVERFHNSVKDRTKVMRNLRDKENLVRFTEGWLVHYNFFKPHMALNNKTPAQKAGLTFNCRSWAEIVKSKC